MVFGSVAASLAISMSLPKRPDATIFSILTSNFEGSLRLNVLPPP